MQTLQFTRALERIATELRADALISFLKPFLTQLTGPQATSPIDEGQKDNFASLVIASQVGYERLKEDPIAERLLIALRLDSTYSPQVFGRLMRHLGSINQRNQVFGNPQIFADIYSLTNSLEWISTFKSACKRLLEEEKIQPAATDITLEVKLLDYDGKGVESARVQQFFQSMDILHAILSQFLKTPDSQLKVAYVDSGSDLLVAFQCAKALIDIMKGLYVEFWEHVKFQPIEAFGKKMDALSKGLTFLGQVKQAVDSNMMSENDAQILGYRVVSEMTALVGIGAAVPQGEETELVDNRQLLMEKRGVKLLGEGKDPNTGTG